MIVADASPNSVMFYRQTIGTKPWNPEQVVAPDNSFSGASIAQVGDSSVIAAGGTDSSLMFYSVPSIAQIKPITLRVRPGQLFP